MPTFIDQYIQHTKTYESPTSFWRWSAYAAISVVLRDNCFRRAGDSLLFPSSFILLFARSSYDRKNNPITLCEQLVNRVSNTKVISGRASIQGIMDELARSETSPITGKSIKGGAAVFFAPELGAAIVEDPAAVKCLTDIYDFKPNPFKSLLRTQPKFKIDRIVLSMFAASNEDMIKDTYNSVAISGGLLARTMLITPNEFRPGISYFDMVADDKSFDCLVKLLTKIAELEGEFKPTPAAQEEYRNWYIPFRESYRNKSEKTGILGRIHTHAIKLAMILAANDMSLVIEKHHIEIAIDECVKLLPNYHQFAMSTGKSNISEAASTILSELLKAKDHKLSTRQLLREHYSVFDIDLLDKTATTLEAGGLLRTLLEGSDRTLQLTEKALEILEGRKEDAR